MQKSLLSPTDSWVLWGVYSLGFLDRTSHRIDANVMSHMTYEHVLDCIVWCDAFTCTHVLIIVSYVTHHINPLFHPHHQQPCPPQPPQVVHFLPQTLIPKWETALFLEMCHPEWLHWIFVAQCCVYLNISQFMLPCSLKKKEREEGLHTGVLVFYCNWCIHDVASIRMELLMPPWNNELENL